MRKVGLFATMSVCLLVGVSSYAFQRGLTARRTAAASRIQFSPGEYRPPYESKNGPQVVLVYFGAASCLWSNQPDLPGIVEAAKVALKARADSLGLGFSTMGVALDWSPTRGLQHLSKFGAFDEVAAGGNYGNHAAHRYIWGRGIAGPAGTPQILILRREVAIDSLGTHQMKEERQLTRIVGANEIRAWQVRGFRAALGGATAVGSPSTARRGTLAASATRP